MLAPEWGFGPRHHRWGRCLGLVLLSQTRPGAACESPPQGPWGREQVLPEPERGAPVLGRPQTGQPHFHHSLWVGI